MNEISNSPLIKSNNKSNWNYKELSPIHSI